MPGAPAREARKKMKRRWAGEKNGEGVGNNLYTVFTALA